MSKKGTWQVVGYCVVTRKLTTTRDGHRFDDFIVRQDGCVDNFNHSGDHTPESGGTVEWNFKTQGRSNLDILICAAIKFHRDYGYRHADLICKQER